jgi:hypothetical protein
MFYTCKNRSGNSYKRLTRAIRRGPQTNDVAPSSLLLYRLSYEKLTPAPRSRPITLVCRLRLKTLNFSYNKNPGAIQGR